jgi:hypothetical protein
MIKKAAATAKAPGMPAAVEHGTSATKHGNSSPGASAAVKHAASAASATSAVATSATSAAVSIRIGSQGHQSNSNRTDEEKMQLHNTIPPMLYNFAEVWI